MFYAFLEDVDSMMFYVKLMKPTNSPKKVTGHFLLIRVYLVLRIHYQTILTY